MSLVSFEACQRGASQTAPTPSHIMPQAPAKHEHKPKNGFPESAAAAASFAGPRPSALAAPLQTQRGCSRSLGPFRTWPAVRMKKLTPRFGKPFIFCLPIERIGQKSNQLLSDTKMVQTRKVDRGVFPSTCDGSSLYLPLICF